MRLIVGLISAMIISSVVIVLIYGLSEDKQALTPKSDSGVSKVSARITPGSDGMTVEQRNIKRRVEEDNKPGSFKHCYLISGFTGDVLFYFMADSKLTSSNKRLTPKTVAAGVAGGSYKMNYGAPISIAGREFITSEVVQDDGTYGSSSKYVYGFTPNDNRIDIYPMGNNTLIVSTRPLRFPKVIMTFESVADEDK